ncbi:MAG: ABC transporter ATP-binding protein [Saccharofermentanales bacterium]|jgi:peptide/nickel transport system ATP-binding protein
MSRILIDVKNLSVCFVTTDGVVSAVNDISFSIREGETLGLVGETGAGKTTTALSILNLIQSPPGEITSGKIYYQDKDILTLPPHELRALRGGDISMIFQDPMSALNPIYTVEAQIAEAIKIHSGVSKQESLRLAREKLELVGIPRDRGCEYPHQFSGGMKQRVVIAMALACSPKFLIADEPTTALDVTIQAQILEMMNDLKREFHSAMLLITHDLGVVAETCNTVAIMYAGEIVEYGSAENIFNSALRHPYTIGLFESLPRLTQEVSRLRPIPGLMPDPMDLPTGCYFHPRCPYATKRCQCEHPVLKDLEDGHRIRCFKEEEGMLTNAE